MIRQLIEQYEFVQAAAIVRGDGRRLRFDLADDFVQRGMRAKPEGWVYIWVKASRNQPLEVCYVGKAGGTLKARCSQHEGGFSGSSKSSKGLENARRIHEFLDADEENEMHVYARKAPDACVLDEAGVSMCEIEEQAMIKKMRRAGASLWNAG